MVHRAEGSSVKGNSQQIWSSSPYVEGGSHSQQQDNCNLWACAKLKGVVLVNDTTPDIVQNRGVSSPLKNNGPQKRFKYIPNFHLFHSYLVWVRRQHFAYIMIHAFWVFVHVIEEMNLSAWHPDVRVVI